MVAVDSCSRSWNALADITYRKVCTILKELDIPYEHRMVEFPEAKQKPFTDVNPNGRLPAIEDPNTGIKLWEVCG